MTQDNHSNEFQSGAELLAAWGLTTREAKLERAVLALMGELDELHQAQHRQSLADNLANTEMFCGCADAYRMGAEALKP